MMESVEQNRQNKTVRPDGGCRAWTVVAASFFISFLQDGFTYSFGLLLPRISEHFQVGRGEAALTSSIMIFLIFASGPMVAGLTAKYSHRLVTVLGVAVSSTGLVLAAAYIHLTTAPSIVVLYLSVGLLTGLGFGLMYLPAWDIVEVYFDRRLGLATGVAAAGSGLGQLVFSPLFHHAELHLGLEGTLYLLAGLVTTGAGAGYFFKPLKHDEEEEEKARDQNGNDNKGFRWEESDPHPRESGSSKVDPEVIETEKHFLASVLETLKSAPIMIVMASHLLMHFAIFATYSFITDRAEQKFGISAEQTSLLLSVMGVANFLGKIIFGSILDRFRTRAFLLTSVILCLNSVSVLAAEFWSSFAGQMAASVVFGFSIGAYDTSVIVIFKLLSEDITIPLGISMFMFALASLIGPTSVGLLYDLTSSFTPGFLTVGCLSLLGMSLIPLVSFIVHRRKD